jgi:transcriptional regulator with XRE-family HTH domain
LCERRFVWPLAKRDRGRWCALLRKLGKLERVRNERSLTVGELARGSGVPRATIAGLEEGTRRAQQTTADKLAAALGVEPGELAEEGVTVLEEKVGDRLRVVKRYDDHALEISYDESRLGDAYRVILESWDGWEEFRGHMPHLEEEYGRDWVVEVLVRIVRARLTGEEFVLPETPSGD